jgi:hypothetical protein
MLVLGAAPWVALQVRQRYENHLWEMLESSKLKRNAALANWRQIYDQLQAGVVSDTDEGDARSRYFAERTNVHRATKRVMSYYRDDQAAIREALRKRAVHAPQTK